jgi:hypothetical protein
MWNSFRNKFNIYWLVAPAALALALSPTCKRSQNFQQSELWKSRTFKKYVLEPIPKSVSDIKVDEIEHPGLGHCYVMRFRIEKADLSLVLNSRLFQKFTSVTYKQGRLTWSGIDKSSDLLRLTLTGGDCLLYTNQQYGPPDWFRPNDWDMPKVYVVKEKYGKSSRYQTKVLIYSEKLEEAYFVEYLEGH